MKKIVKSIFLLLAIFDYDCEPGVILFCPQLIGKPCRVHHCLLRLLLRVLRLLQHLVHLSVDGVKVALQRTLVARCLFGVMLINFPSSG